MSGGGVNFKILEKKTGLALTTFNLLASTFLSSSFDSPSNSIGFTYSTNDSFQTGLFVSRCELVLSLRSPRTILAYGLFKPRPSFGARPAASTTKHKMIVSKVI